MTPGVKKALRIFLDHGGPLRPRRKKSGSWTTF